MVVEKVDIYVNTRKIVDFKNKILIVPGEIVDLNNRSLFFKHVKREEAYSRAFAFGYTSSCKLINDTYID